VLRDVRTSLLVAYSTFHDDASAVTDVDQLRAKNSCIVQNLKFQIHALLNVFQDYNLGLVRLFKTDHLLCHHVCEQNRRHLLLRMTSRAKTLKFLRTIQKLVHAIHVRIPDGSTFGPQRGVAAYTTQGAFEAAYSPAAPAKFMYTCELLKVRCEKQNQ